MKNASQLREQVFARSQGYCEKCGNSLFESFALHHRKLKSRGGKDTVENLLALHHECHNFGTDAVHFNVALAEKHGWIVSSYADPADVSVTLSDGSSVMLSKEGTYIYREG